jgi:peptide/nickel transport system permease protein
MVREARVTRGVVLQIRAFDFAEAAYALETKDHHLLPRHLLSHGLSPLTVQRLSVLAYAISTETPRSSLGVGAPAELPSRGHMLSDWGRPS